MIKYGYDDGARGVEAKIWVENRALKIKIYGSNHWWDWLINLKMWRKEGFHAGWLKEAKKLYAFIRMHELPDNDIHILGLSAGGAIGGILRWLYFIDCESAYLITINSPKFCNRRRMGIIKRRMLSLVHRGDIVTYLPPFYAAPKRKHYGDKTWFWKAHNETPEEWKEF